MSEYAKRKIEREQRFGELIRVHEITGCLRKAFFNRKFPIEKEHKHHTPYELWGRIIENSMRKVLRREYGWFDDVYVHNHILEGHPDYVNFLKRQIIEVKFHQAGGVRAKDISQTNVYAGLLDFDSFTIRVCQLDLGTPKIYWTDYEYKFDRDIFRKQVELAEFFKHVLETNNVSLIKYYPKEPYECNQCVYKKLCEKVEENE